MRGDPEPRRINDALFGGQVKCDYQVSCKILLYLLRILQRINRQIGKW